jgi:hypothetical protein
MEDRCLLTGHECGSDTWSTEEPTCCLNCQKWYEQQHPGFVVEDFFFHHIRNTYIAILFLHPELVEQYKDHKGSVRVNGEVRQPIRIEASQRLFCLEFKEPIERYSILEFTDAAEEISKLKAEIREEIEEDIMSNFSITLNEDCEYSYRYLSISIKFKDKTIAHESIRISE